jgi:plasmid maintenance system antidote protein VapI
MATKPAWKRGDFFLLDTVQFLPAAGKIRVWYENHEVGEAPAHVLWNGRAGEPDWRKARVDPQTRGALLVPTRPSGEVAEIPSDVIRAATDVDYHAYVSRRAAAWAKRVGDAIAQLREERGFSQKRLADAAQMDPNVVAAIERGRQECSAATIGKLIEAMGAKAPGWLKASSK